MATTHDDDRIPPPALALGFGGVIPFAAAALAVMLGGVAMVDKATALFALVAYGAVILSFLGGVRWGAALQADDPDRRAATLAISVVPSLAGWVALLMPAIWGLILLTAGFLAQGYWDVARSGDALPAWFRRLRILLTVTVSTILAVTVVVLSAGA